MLDLTLDGFDLIHDLYGKISGVKFFAAGNQWFALEEILPRMANVFMETLPPGVVMKQMMGEAVKIGNLVIDVKPDVVSLPSSLMEQVKDMVLEPTEYVENEVVIATSLKVKDICDLSGLRLALPNPENEGIGDVFRKAYEEECGDYSSLRERSYVTKVHHRETPLLMRNGLVNAGVMWNTEAIKWGFKSVGTGRKGKLSIAVTKFGDKEGGENVKKVVLSSESRSVYEKYAFKWMMSRVSRER